MVRNFLLLLCLIFNSLLCMSQRLYDGSGRQIGRFEGERLYDGSGRQIGRIDGDRIYDGSGSQIGRSEGLRRMQLIIFFYFFM